MAKKVRELKPIEVQRLASVDGFHNVGGVVGLYLQVKGAAASWVLRVKIANRRRDIGLGSYPSVTLSQAREAARDVRERIRQGVDPVQERKAARAALITMPTFNWCAEQLINAKRPGWKNPKHAAQWETTLQTYAAPVIGKLPIDQIEHRHVMDVLAPIWNSKTETANRVRGRIEAVLDWAKVAGYRSGDNPAEWRGNLEHTLPAPRKVSKVKHHPALPIDAMHEFMPALREREGMAARALEFTILTAARTGEVRGAMWAEIDLERGVWTIPARRMKADKDHVIPLSEAAVALLRALPRMAGTGLVFPALRGGELSDATLAKVIKLMHAADLKGGGIGFVDPKELDANGKPRIAVPHGFRSTFRDWAAERTSYPHEMAEMALAHTVGNKVEAAYRRGDLFDKRRRMMSDWANFIGTPPAKGNVHPIRQKAG